jgi:citrate synthase
MKGLAKLRAMLTANMGAQTDTTELSKRAQKSREQAELLNNPRALEYFKEQGATDETLQRMRDTIGKQAKAQADSLSSMRQQMRAASTERARQAFGNEALDRATKAGFNVIAEEPSEGGKGMYTWERRLPDDQPIPQYDSRRMTYRSDTSVPDEDMLRQQRLMRMWSSGRLSPQAFADSMKTVPKGNR